MNGPHIAAMPAGPAAPRPPAGAPRHAKPEAEANPSLRILTYLRLHWLMIAFCGTLLGGTGAYAAWELLPSKFESYSLLQVSSAPTALASSNNPNQGRTDFATYVKTTATLVKADFVLNAALRDIKDLNTIKNQKDPIKFLNEELVVLATDGSEVVKVSMAGHDPGDVKKIVDAVQKAFMAEVVQKEIMEKKVFLQKVEDAKQQVQTLLEVKQKRSDNILKASGTDNAPMPFPVPPMGGGVGLAPAPALMPGAATDLIAKHDPKSIVGRYAKYLEECEKLPIDIQMGRNRLKELEAKLSALKAAPIDPATMTLVDKDEDVIKQSLRMKQAKSRYEFARSSGDENAPEVQAYRAAWEAHEAKLKEIKEEKGKVLEGAKRVLEVKQILAEGETLKHQVERLEVQLSLAKASLDRSGKQLVELPAPGPVVTAGGIERVGTIYDPNSTDLVTTDSIYSRLVQQWHLTKLELDSPARVKLLQPASAPVQKDMKKQILASVAGGLMGYILLALGIVAYELAGKRISSLADVKGTGPAPVVGVIPCKPSEAVGNDPVKRAAANEAIDKLRAYVSQTWLARGATTVAVTSPLGDEGKAFAAFGLASSLAQAGCKTLVVDFDLREPALHTYAGVPNIGGVCEVLRGEVEPRVAVQSLPSGLDLMTAGKWSDEARRAAVGGRLEALLSRLKEPYDCVVLHATSLLTVAESVEVARRCEVVLVCAQFRETKMPLLRRATDRVAAMEIPYSGVVYVGSTEHEALC
jgi:Mrp family chromosome partitioning ATPase